MKAILAFDLPEEAEAFRRHANAQRAFAALESFRYWLRSGMKYRDPPPDIEEIWDNFHAILSEEGIEL